MIPGHFVVNFHLKIISMKLLSVKNVFCMNFHS